MAESSVGRIFGLEESIRDSSNLEDSDWSNLILGFERFGESEIVFCARFLYKYKAICNLSSRFWISFPRLTYNTNNLNTTP